MLTFGLIIFTLGLSLRLALNLTARNEKNILSPRRISERNFALSSILEKRRMFVVDANILMAAGFILFLFARIFN